MAAGEYAAPQQPFDSLNAPGPHLPEEVDAANPLFRGPRDFYHGRVQRSAEEHPGEGRPGPVNRLTSTRRTNFVRRRKAECSCQN